MANRLSLTALALAGALLLAGCQEAETGPLRVSAIGGEPRFANPNLRPLDPPSAFLLEAAAQGLVRFDASGQIEPALAQSWIVSDDGIRYTFRLSRTQWADGGKVTSEQVVARLKAAASRASNNPLKPLLGAIAEIEAMTDDVLEISLKSPRPHFLELLAQPEMAILRNGIGTGPYLAAPGGGGNILLSMTPAAEEEEPGPRPPNILLRGESAAMAVARFQAGLADLVAGGTLGDLPIARAADPPGAARRIDPVSGMLGLVFTGGIESIWAEPEARAAMSMALDRPAIIAVLAVPDLVGRESLVPQGIQELPAPALPAWSPNPLPMRRAEAAASIARLSEGGPVTVRVAVPEGPGYCLLFALLRRDWRAIGVDAQRVVPSEHADLRLIDEVAPISLSTWYLRHFTCDRSRICSEEADGVLELARNARTVGERRTHLTTADRMITDLAVYVPIAAPVRWSLISPRLTGFQPNAFGRRFPGSLVAAPR